MMGWGGIPRRLRKTTIRVFVCHAQSQLPTSPTLGLGPGRPFHPFSVLVRSSPGLSHTASRNDGHIPQHVGCGGRGG